MIVLHISVSNKHWSAHDVAITRSHEGQQLCILLPVSSDLFATRGSLRESFKRFWMLCFFVFVVSSSSKESTSKYRASGGYFRSIKTSSTYFLNKWKGVCECLSKTSSNSKASSRERLLDLAKNIS